MADSPRIVPEIYVTSFSVLANVSGLVGQRAVAQDTFIPYIYDGTNWINIPLGLITGRGSTPTVTMGTGAGANATFSVEGDNISGIISLKTGTSLATNAALFTITLADNASFPSNMITHLGSIGTNPLDVINGLTLAVMTANSNTYNLKGLSLSPLTDYKLSYLNTGYKK